jgi:predicted ATPase/class 3 adenylate cyclase
VSIPSGNVTFLFTDIEGSTKLAHDFHELLQEVLQKHQKILQEAIAANSGYVFRILGDAFFCSFEKSADAVKAAVEAQILLSKEQWNGVTINVRMGIHAGDAEWNGTDYDGYLTLARTNRIMSAAYGEQIVISEKVYTNLAEELHLLSASGILFRDLGQRRLKDVVLPIRLFQVTAPGLREEFPPLKTLDARPNNLPVQLTSFVGREDVIDNIKNLLKQTHLLTLIGFGGTGKTRLAMQIGADLIDEFNHGVFFAELSPFSEPSLISQALINIFELQEELGKTQEESLTGYLKDKQMLIILDNCEHMIVESAAFAEVLLKNCPNLKIIATSREALMCSGEQTFRVPPLGVPNESAEVSLEHLMEFESARLFVERARLVNPEFRIDELTAVAVAGICRQLEGIPLAIELAAVRTKVLPVEKIFQRLNDRFKLLTGGMRTAETKQQTLKAMVDWSYDMLSPEEKKLLNRLSVFSGGWTLDAAEEVCSGNGLDNVDILDLLSRLADKSLILPCTGNKRYNILETIRQYAEQKKDESNEAEMLIQSHLEFYLEHSEEIRNNLEKGIEKQMLDSFETEMNNFRKAMSNSIIIGRREKGLKIALNLSRFWEIRGYIKEGRNRILELLGDADEINSKLRASTFQWLGTLEWITGDFEKAKKYYDKSLRLYRNLNNLRGVGTTLGNLGLIAQSQGDYEKAKMLNERSFKSIKEFGDKGLIADSLFNAVAPSIYLKDYEKAEEKLNECLRIYRELNDLRGIAMSLSNLGSLAGVRLDYAKAVNHLEESLKIQRELGDTRGLASTLDNLGSLYGHYGNYWEAEKYFDESIRISTELSDKKSLAFVFNNYGFLRHSMGHDIESIELHRKSFRLSQENNFESGMRSGLIGIAETLSTNNSEKAAIILGFVNHSVQSAKVVLHPDIQAVFENTIQHVKDNLSQNFDQNWSAGTKLTFEEAIQLADL